LLFGANIVYIFLNTFSPVFCFSYKYMDNSTSIPKNHNPTPNPLKQSTPPLNPNTIISTIYMYPFRLFSRCWNNPEWNFEFAKNAKIQKKIHLFLLLSSSPSTKYNHTYVHLLPFIESLHFIIDDFNLK
jgi:hypothetical protein